MQTQEILRLVVAGHTDEEIAAPALNPFMRPVVRGKLAPPPSAADPAVAAATAGACLGFDMAAATVAAGEGAIAANKDTAYATAGMLGEAGPAPNTLSVAVPILLRSSPLRRRACMAVAVQASATVRLCFRRREPCGCCTGRACRARLPHPAICSLGTCMHRCTHGRCCVNTPPQVMPCSRFCESNRHRQRSSGDRIDGCSGSRQHGETVDQVRAFRLCSCGPSLLLALSASPKAASNRPDSRPQRPHERCRVHVSHKSLWNYHEWSPANHCPSCCSEASACELPCWRFQLRSSHQRMELSRQCVAQLCVLTLV